MRLSKKIQRLEKQLDNLAYKICEVEMDFDENSPNNRKYRKLREELAFLDEERNDLCRTFSGHWY
ncbi:MULTISPECIES: hypothetical protein [unclassified Lysinibacillus]|uniref:hypothetical protein n=1 Tax=unclassified Lysinibacillus TaxID=2636778 RepID=UPI0037FC1C2E